ncbi:hypothetical protein WN990_36845 [Kitasatospora purpeofusca]|uniref:hypothetical protein n=1 Tax=Kitasatospora purpeofusca TaxID=67352 RepID=UPI0030F2759A
MHWNNGQTSTVSNLTYVTTTTAGITQSTGTGTVTPGEFTGGTGVLTYIYALVNPSRARCPADSPARTAASSPRSPADRTQQR